MLNYENLIGRFEEVIHSKEWSELQAKFNKSNNIYILGHGGNLAVADHAAADITRLSNGQRLAQAPGSAILATSLINDTDFDQWMVSWMEAFTRNKTDEQISQSLVLGISSSGRSKDIIKALQWANTRGLNVACITSHELSEKVELTLANLSILKTGKAKAIRFSTLEAICRVLECQPGDILEYTAEK
jgi:DNA-binding Xre family transcriptional regulator